MKFFVTNLNFPSSSVASVKSFLFCLMIFLKTQLVLKRVISVEEWEEMREHIQYDFLFDNHFQELKTRNSITTVLILRSRWNPTWVVITPLSISRNKFSNKLIQSVKRLAPDQERTCCWYYSAGRSYRCYPPRESTRSWWRKLLAI